MTLFSRLQPGQQRLDVQRALRWFNWQAGLRAPVDVICPVTGFIFVDFALALGIPKEHIGYFAALVSAAAVMQLVGLWAVSAFRERKRFVVLFAALEIVLLITAVLLTPGLPSAWRMGTLAVLLLLSASANYLIRPTTDEWLATAIPARVRGRYLGRRFQILCAASVVAILAGGYLAQRVPQSDARGFALLLLGGGVLGLLAVVAWWHIPPPAVPAVTVRWADLPEILRHKPYLFYLLGLMCYDFPFFIVTPYYQVYHLRVLNLHEAAIAWIAISYYLTRSLASGICGRWVDRLGVRKILLLITPSYLILFGAYVVSTPGTVWLIYAASALAGVGDAVFGVVAAASLYATVPESSARQAYFAVYNLSLLLLTGLGAIVGVHLLDMLQGHQLLIANLTLTPFHLLFAIAFVVLVLAIPGIWGFPQQTTR